MKKLNELLSSRFVTNVLMPFTFITLITAVLIKLFLIVIAEKTENNAIQLKRAMIKCPSILSIARDGRDTLIVMKYDSACNQFVLDSLK